MTTLHAHLKERHLNVELYPNMVLSEETNSATFMLWNLSGELVGYQQYTPERPKMDSSLDPRELRYFTYLKSEHQLKALTAFGVELLDQSQKYVFVLEGVFDTCRLHNLGLNALGMLACDPKFTKSWLWSLGYTVVPVCEGDKAGQKLAKLANTDEVVYLPEGKDLGDLTDEEVLEYFSKYL
jgi:hypothetical protein